jgi:hypothetical protein
MNDFIRISIFHRKSSICLSKWSDYKHWEYHGLENVQVDPEAHVVGPVYPVPPHCPHFATVPVEVVEDVDAFEELVEDEPDFEVLVDPTAEDDDEPPVERVPV